MHARTHAHAHTQVHTHTHTPRHIDARTRACARTNAGAQVRRGEPNPFGLFSHAELTLLAKSDARPHTRARTRVHSHDTRAPTRARARGIHCCGIP